MTNRRFISRKKIGEWFIYFSISSRNYSLLSFRNKRERGGVIRRDRERLKVVVGVCIFGGGGVPEGGSQTVGVKCKSVCVTLCSLCVCECFHCVLECPFYIDIWICVYVYELNRFRSWLPSLLSSVRSTLCVSVFVCIYDYNLFLSFSDYFHMKFL